MTASAASRTGRYGAGWTGRWARYWHALAHWHARPTGGGADVGDRREQGVLPEVIGLPPGDLIQQVRFGPAVEGRCCQHGVLELAVVPAAEGALRQEPLAQSRQGQRVRAAGHAPTQRVRGEQELPVRYFRDWMALWPLLAMALAAERAEQAVEHARGMLPSPQQLLPEPVRTPVEGAVQAWDEGLAAESGQLLRLTVDAAGELGYL
jgi:hypothetical protein